jgi:hypothetical protein
MKASYLSWFTTCGVLALALTGARDDDNAVF